MRAEAGADFAQHPATVGAPVKKKIWNDGGQGNHCTDRPKDWNKIAEQHHHNSNEC